MSIRILVEWGYEPHALVLEDEAWQRILNGAAMDIEGDGFAYEGETFTVTWSFSGGLDGELVVTYRPDEDDPMDEGTGFIGTLQDSSITEL